MKRFESHPDELISASLSGDLTDVERRELDAHLATCQTCRETLDAFSQQRHLLADLPVSRAPRDLGPRVRAGIEGGRFGTPWWRRPGGLLAGAASVLTVAAAALLAAFFLTGGLKRPPVPASSPPSKSAAPTASLAATSTPAASVEPSPSARALPLAMAPGNLIYPALRGSVEHPQFTVENNANGQRVTVTPPSGQPISAALSPDGEWLAYICVRGLSGANEVAAVHLTDGSIVDLGTTEGSAPFTDRLVWSPDGRYLAFTKAPFDMQTGKNTDPNGAGSTEAYLFDTASQTTTRLTATGNAYAASWGPVGGGQEILWISLASQNPHSVAVLFPVSTPPVSVEPAQEGANADGVFLPLISPDGTRAIFWRGTMNRAGGTWSFISAGLPYLTTASRTGGPPRFDNANPLFSDLSVTGPSDTFATGEFGWSGDSSTFAFWNGHWSGLEEPTGYPDEHVVYVGKATDPDLLTLSSGLTLSLSDSDGIAGVALGPDGTHAAVTVRHATAGDTAAPSASLLTVDLATGKSQEVAPSSRGWLGPPTYFSPAGAQ
jgi:hypothetical protein